VQRDDRLSSAWPALDDENAGQIRTDDAVLLRLNGRDDVTHPAGSVRGERSEQSSLAVETFPLVVIERMTRFRLSPDQEGPTTIEAFQEQEYFDGELPTELVREFIAVNREPSRLEGRFHFGVGYRFATGDMLEEPEVSLVRPVTVTRATPLHAPPVLDRLAFSRVARSLRNDHALIYVEALRPDGTGAGFLVWCRRQGRSWTLFATEVTWTIQVQVEPEGG
jgi:hypothetical protein